MNQRFLILDTPDESLRALEDAFRKACNRQCEVERALSLAELKNKLHSGLPWDLLIMDIELGDGVASGQTLIKTLRNNNPDLPIVAVAASGDVDLAGKAVEAGANDFMVRAGKLTDRIQTLLDKLNPTLSLMDRNRMLKEQNMLLRQAAERQYQMVGESPQLLSIVAKIERIASIPRPVLITGERGTGKELVARAIHLASPDSTRPLISVNCAAFSDSLLESELFGHEKGSFTGADSRSHGKFEQADGGTLFLDEIGNMSLAFQQKILRVVEYGTFTRVGGNEEVKVKTRIVAATNVNLKARIKSGDFLSDLYDRLSFEIIRVPALRDREGDITLLSRHFLHGFMNEIPALQGKHLSQAALKELEAYSFPGNVRELKNIIERAAYRDTTNEITPEDIGMLASEPLIRSGDTFEQKVDQFKQQLIRQALSECNSNQAAAARQLGLSYHQYRYFLKKYGTPAKL